MQEPILKKKNIAFCGYHGWHDWYLSANLKSKNNLDQHLMSGLNFDGIPENSRAALDSGHLQKNQITPEVVKQVQELNKIARDRNQSLAQMAVAWLLKDERVTSVLVGVSKVKQLEDNIAALEHLEFSSVELEKIESILRK